MDASGNAAKVARIDDCIGCTSCMYLCPSRCLEVTDYAVQRPFYRIEQNAAIISKFLQKKPASQVLTEADYDEAIKDISHRLVSLSETMVETIGRGQRALGRSAGNLAAAHLPELYEAHSTDEILDKLRQRFAHCFAFDSTPGDTGIGFTFQHCAIQTIVQSSGQKVGECSLCVLFHEYWAGLVSAFTGVKYDINVLKAGGACELKLQNRA
jgi:ferredoxin